MLQAVKYLHRVGVGVTVPCLFVGNDGHTYVVKFKNNRLGAKVLVNEYLAAQLGKLAELCFPASGLIEIPEQVIRQSVSLRRRHVKPGVHFASRYISHVQYLQHYHLPKICNRQEIAGVILFDHIMHNEDRTLNRKNMLVKREAEGYRFYAIDNSHLFGSGRWRNSRIIALIDRVTINDRRAYGSLLRHYLTPDDFRPYIDKFEAISQQQLMALINSIPQEWLCDEPTKELLQQFIGKRCQYATLIAERIFEKIPVKQTK